MLRIARYDGAGCFGGHPQATWSNIMNYNIHFVIITITSSDDYEKREIPSVLPQSFQTHSLVYRLLTVILIISKHVQKTLWTIIYNLQIDIEYINTIDINKNTNLY